MTTCRPASFRVALFAAVLCPAALAPFAGNAQPLAERSSVPDEREVAAVDDATAVAAIVASGTAASAGASSCPDRLSTSCD